MKRQCDRTLGAMYIADGDTGVAASPMKLDHRVAAGG